MTKTHILQRLCSSYFMQGLILPFSICISPLRAQRPWKRTKAQDVSQCVWGFCMGQDWGPFLELGSNSWGSLLELSLQHQPRAMAETTAGWPSSHASSSTKDFFATEHFNHFLANSLLLKVTDSCSSQPLKAQAHLFHTSLACKPSATTHNTPLFCLKPSTVLLSTFSFSPKFCLAKPKTQAPVSCPCLLPHCNFFCSQPLQLPLALSFLGFPSCLEILSPVPLPTSQHPEH